MKKYFWMNKETLQKMFPKLNIIVGTHPVFKINNIMLTAIVTQMSTHKEDKWKEFNQVNVYEIIQELIALNSYFFMLECKDNDIASYIELTNKDIMDVENKIIKTNNIEEADKIIFRYYTTLIM